MNTDIEKEISTLMNDRVWVTKKARMEAESRMNRNNLRAQILVNYYTFWVLSFSIWTLVSQEISVSLLTVIASVGLFGVSIFVNSIGYREKALKYKDSYISLNDLEFDLKHLLREKKNSDKIEVSEINKLEKRYSEILTKSENHHDVDYIKVQLKHRINVNSSELFKYYINTALNYFGMIILLFSPIALLIIYIGGFL